MKKMNPLPRQKSWKLFRYAMTSVILTFGVIGMQSCQKDMPGVVTQVSQTKEDQQKRVDYPKKKLDFKSFSGFKGDPSDYSFTVVAAVAPPVVDGQAVQAAYVYTEDSKIYVAYNTAGEEYRGALDVYEYSLDPTNTTLTAVHSLGFPGSDINSVARIPDTGDAYEIFIVGASIAHSAQGVTSPAFLNYFSADFSSQQILNLNGYAANSISFEPGSDKFTIITGSNGGLYVFDRPTLSQLDYVEKDNLTSVFNFQSLAYQVCSEPISLELYNLSDASQTNISLSGYESNPVLKSSVEVSNGFSFLALNEGGTVIVKNIDGSIVETLTPANPGGVDPEYLHSNGLSFGGYRLYSANGGGGITVSELDQDMQATPMGNIEINSSVNHVSIIETDGSNGYLAVATGTGGVMIINFAYSGTESESLKTDEYGGTYQLFNNNMKVEIPTAALSAEETITVTLDRDFSIPGIPDEASIAFEFTPDGLSFSIPITVTWYGDFDPAITYTLVYYDPGTGTTTSMPVTIAADGSYITFSTNHFSQFVLYSKPIDLGCENSFVDPRDGNEYCIVTIGIQTWMAENLAYLPSVSPSTDLSDTDPYFYVYGYEGSDVSAAKATDNYSIYGVLYNWEAALTSCPDGWHLPTDAEWTTLTDYLGASAGGKLKEIGTAHWDSPNTGATNESGFTALPGGNRSTDAGFNHLGSYAVFWSSSEGGSDPVSSYAWTHNVGYAHDGVTRFNFYRLLGYSVRCVKN